MFDPLTLILAAPLALVTVAVAGKALDLINARQCKLAKARRTFRALDDAAAQYGRTRR